MLKSLAPFVPSRSLVIIMICVAVLMGAVSGAALTIAWKLWPEMFRMIKLTVGIVDSMIVATIIMLLRLPDERSLVHYLSD